MAHQVAQNSIRTGFFPITEPRSKGLPSRSLIEILGAAAPMAIPESNWAAAERGTTIANATNIANAGILRGVRSILGPF